MTQSLYVYKSFVSALASVALRELNSTSWAPPVYPFKIIMALTLVFLLMQGISGLLKDVRFLAGDRAS